MTPVAGPPPVSRMPRSELTVTVAVIAVLTVAATVVGTLEWPLPERVSGGWQIADIPTSLIALLTVSTLICLLAATALTVRSPGLRLGEPAALGWLLIALSAAGALVFNALVLAADAAVVVGALIPVFHWLFTLVPALLAGAVAARRGSAAATAAAHGDRHRPPVRAGLGALPVPRVLPHGRAERAVEHQPPRRPAVGDRRRDRAQRGSDAGVAGRGGIEPEPEHMTQLYVYSDHPLR
jgi:hypothetical protein